MSDETPLPDAPARLRELLDEAIRRSASDIHLTPGVPACLRIDGELAPCNDASVLTPHKLAQLASALIAAAGITTDVLAARIQAKGSLDGALSSADGVRFRFNIFKRQGYDAIVLRRLEDRFRTLSELGLPESLYRLCDQRDGLVVVSGATGSGKSTTLASLIDRINRERAVHIVTIEDPIEYIHKPVKGLVNQRQIGLDAPTFNDALVASLRQDPDVILVGEIRDLDTIRTAITAAETGHLVFTTLHAGDCVSSIERLVSVFPADEQDG
ncbi:MAG TPA: ATPase, T2SS/T4P/T4SS family, partial [Planctomycetota bacterium]|nr:ATPase, T2SS/T4P/T4SS family [Planctomycetota bacterium]